jgi:hypothetical protein
MELDKKTTSLFASATVERMVITGYSAKEQLLTIQHCYGRCSIRRESLICQNEAVIGRLEASRSLFRQIVVSLGFPS